MRSIIFAVLAFAAAASGAAAAPTVGATRVEIALAHHGRAAAGVVWYPASDAGRPSLVGDNPVFRGVEAALDAAPVGETAPLALLSHGLGGNVRSMGWLAAGLAERGAIVALLNHPSSTTTDFDLRLSIDHWTRAQDMSATLDWLAAHPRLGPLTDPSRVMAAGFSDGGWTALSLGGVVGDLDAYGAHCAKVGDRSSHCADLNGAGVRLSSVDGEAWSASYRDPRITHVAAIDPALHWGLERRHERDLSARDLSARVLLIGLGDGDDRLFATNFGPEGGGLQAHVDKAAIAMISPAWHFSALPICKPSGAAILKDEGEDPVCDDPPGADRAAIHKEIVDRIAATLGL